MSGISIIFLYISSELLKIFKGPGPLNLKKTVFNGLRTSQVAGLNQGAYAAKSRIQVHSLYIVKLLDFFLSFCFSGLMAVGVVRRTGIHVLAVSPYGSL
jgi:hypothetical protein